MLARRSQDVRTYRGRWAAISGYLEGHDPRQQAEQEIQEETGLSSDQVQFIQSGKPLTIDDKPHFWTVYPFRYQLDRGVTVDLDREHTEFQWIAPGDWQKLNTVPKLYETWERVK